MKRTLLCAMLALLWLLPSTQRLRAYRPQVSSPAEVQQWTRKGMQWLYQGKYARADSAFSQAYRLLPSHRSYDCARARLLMLRSRALRGLRDNSAAMDMYQSVLASGCKQPLLLERARRLLRHLRTSKPKSTARDRRRPKRFPVPAPPHPAPIVAQPPPLPASPAEKTDSRPRRYRHFRFKRKKRTSRSLYNRSHRSFDHGIRTMGLIPGREEKSGKISRKYPKLQVWQRSNANTFLSKVSVGGKRYLTLKKLRVSVQVEGMRVRTIVDHIYHNPHKQTLQGTFKYTLPPDASVSYYAMFVGRRQQQQPRFFSGKVPTHQHLLRMRPQQIARTAPPPEWGQLREARLVPSEEGRKVYEEVTRQRIDPALLEQDAPNTFTGRVFPVPPNGHNRVILAYEQTLPQLQKHHVYRFRFPQDVADWIDFSVGYNDKLARMVRSNLKTTQCKWPQKEPFVRCYWEGQKPKEDAVFYFRPKQDDVAWVAGEDPIDGKRYLLSQLRVTLPPSPLQTSAQHAIFLLDTSLSENPDLFAAHVALLKKLLTKNPNIKKFNVLFFDVGALWANPRGWMNNDDATRRKLLARIEKIVLEGATDLSAAMQELARPSWLSSAQRRAAAKISLDAFLLSDGQLNWGQRRVEKMLHQFQLRRVWKRTRFFAYQLGIGDEHVELFRRLVRQGGAVFLCLNKAELDRCATAHQRAAMVLSHVDIQGVEAQQIAVAGRQTSVFPGGLVTIASQFKRNGNARITLHGTYLGRPFQQTFQFNISSQGDLGPRAWAEMSIAQLLELEDPSLKPLIVAYAQHFHIPNKHCSFLILETDKEYKQYGLEKELKARKVQDVAKFLSSEWSHRRAPISDRQRWIALLHKVAKRDQFLHTSAGRTALSLLRALPSGSFVLNSPPTRKLWLQSMVQTHYLKTRTQDPNDFSPFVKEAKQRLPRDVQGAVRALSSIVELHPGNPQALRLVGYYLRAWNQPVLAARAFLRVLERRSFEPHAFRDVAISLQRLKRFGLAAAMYEVMLAGRWHSRFGAFTTLAREEYALLLVEALDKSNDLPGHIRRILNSRRSTLGLSLSPSRLRVTVTWNTDNTDVDLWVTGPSKQKCYYRRKSTPDGGRLLEDITRGYGPERYENKTPTPGQYHVQLHFYGHSSNVLGNETHISTIIVQHAGTTQQSYQYKNLVLKQRGNAIHVDNIQIASR